MTSHSTMRACQPRRLGSADVLQLRDGSLRALLECGGPVAAARTVGVLVVLRHPTQLVTRARRPSITDQTPIWARLRASHAMLLARLAGEEPALLHRVLVSVPWDVEEGGDGLALLDARVGDIHRRLDEANLDPVRVVGRDLDDVASLDVVHEGKCEVRVGERFERTLIIPRLPERFPWAGLGTLRIEHDLSLHVRPATRPDHVELGAYLSLWSDTRSSLDSATERVEALFAAQGIRARRPHLQAEPALVSAMPLGVDGAGARRALTVDDLRSACTPPSPANDQALLYGADPGTRCPVKLDRFALPNPHAVVFGEATARSRLLVLELTRARLYGHHVHLVDPVAACLRPLSALGSRLVGPSACEPIRVPGEEGALEARIEALLELIAGGLTPAASAAARDAIAFAYAARGHSHEGCPAGLTSPSLGEIRSALLRRSARVPRSSQSELVALAGRLERHATDASRVVEEEPSPPLGPLSVHVSAGLCEEVRHVCVLLSLDRIWRSAPAGHGSLVTLDEADRVVTGAAGRFVTRLMASGSERRVGLTVATEQVAALLHGPVREYVLGAGLTVLLRQPPDAMELLAEAYRLTPAEQSWLIRASVDEGLLIAQGRRIAFRAVASEEEEQLITGGTR